MKRKLMILIPIIMLTITASLGAVIINNNLLPTTPATPDQIRNLIEGERVKWNSIKDLDPDNQFTIIAEGEFAPGKSRVMTVESLALLTTPTGYTVGFELAVIHFQADKGSYRITMMQSGSGSVNVNDKDTNYVIILYMDEVQINVLKGTGGTSILPLDITINGIPEQATVVKPDYEGETPQDKQLSVLFSSTDNEINLKSYEAGTPVATLEVITNFGEKDKSGFLPKDNNPPHVTIYPSDAMGNLNEPYAFQHSQDSDTKYPYTLTITGDANNTIGSGLTGKHNFDVDTLRSEVFYGNYTLTIAPGQTDMTNAKPGEYYSYISANVQAP